MVYSIKQNFLTKARFAFETCYRHNMKNTHNNYIILQCDDTSSMVLTMLYMLYRAQSITTTSGAIYFGCCLLHQKTVRLTKNTKVLHSSSLSLAITINSNYCLVLSVLYLFSYPCTLKSHVSFNTSIFLLNYSLGHVGPHVVFQTILDFSSLYKLFLYNLVFFCQCVCVYININLVVILLMIDLFW